ncbi:helix-turn-helix domain-containing protein, partial [Cloacibacillus evryensis]
MSHQEDTTKERKATPHINRCERDTIERFYKEGLSIGQIALLLKRDKSTIKREIKRGTVTQVKQNPSYSKKVDWSERISYTIYLAEVGQKRYEENRKRCGA